MTEYVKAKKGKKIACPQCTSIQVKRLTLLPKKHPRPTPWAGETTSSPDFVRRAVMYERSFECQKCGDKFVVLTNGETARGVEQLIASLTNTTVAGSPPPAPPIKKKSLLWRLVFWLFLLPLFLVLGFGGLNMLLQK